jgi:hypothetical protein
MSNQSRPFPSRLKSVRNRTLFTGFAGGNSFFGPIAPTTGGTLTRRNVCTLHKSELRAQHDVLQVATLAASR